MAAITSGKYFWWDALFVEMQNDIEKPSYFVSFLPPDILRIFKLFAEEKLQDQNEWVKTIYV